MLQPRRHRAAVLSSRRRRRQRTILERAVAAWRVDRYSGAGDLLDLSGNGHHARFGSTSGADTNDPLFLPFVGEKYLRLPGTNGNYASTPDSAAVSITGDIDIRVRVAMDDWTPAAESALLAKWGGGLGENSYRFTLDTSGRLSFSLSTDGTTPIFVELSTALGLAAGAVKWVRVTYDADADGTNYAVTFYTSDDGATWTTINQETGAKVAATADGSGLVEIGSTDDGGAKVATAKVYRAQIYSGIDGTLVADFDPSRSAEPHTSFVASTGETWTINRSASGRKAALVDRPLLLFGTDDYLEVADHADLDFGAADDFTVVAVLRTHAPTPSAHQVVIGKASNITAQGWRVYNTTGGAQHNFRIDDGSATGKEAAGSAVTAGASTVIAATRIAASDLLRVMTNGVVAVVNAVAENLNLANASALRVGNNGGSGNYADMEFIGAAIFREALTDAEIAQLNTEFGV